MIDERGMGRGIPGEKIKLVGTDRANTAEKTYLRKCSLHSWDLNLIWPR